MAPDMAILPLGDRIVPPHPPVSTSGLGGQVGLGWVPKPSTPRKLWSFLGMGWGGFFSATSSPKAPGTRRVRGGTENKCDRTWQGLRAQDC